MQPYKIRILVESFPYIQKFLLASLKELSSSSYSFSIRVHFQCDLCRFVECLTCFASCFDSCFAWRSFALNLDTLVCYGHDAE